MVRDRNDVHRINRFGDDNLRRDLGFWCDTIEEVDSCVSKVLEVGYKPFPDRFLHDMLYKVDGQASARIVQEIRRMGENEIYRD